MVNTNPETGIRYGVVSLNSLADWVFEEFIYQGRNLSFEEWRDELIAQGIDPDDPDSTELEYESDEDTYELETADGLKLGLSTLGGAYNVWVFESKHVANHALCSPCCPNAGDIDSDGDYPCYTLPPEWFERD